MKQKFLLFLIIGSLSFSANAQRKEQRTTAYAITAPQKGSSAWTEVKLIDVKTGEVIKSVYANTDEVATLNARTKKPVAKKEASAPENLQLTRKAFTTTTDAGNVRQLTGNAVKSTYKDLIEERIVYKIDLQNATNDLQKQKLRLTEKPTGELKEKVISDVKNHINVITVTGYNVRRGAEILDRPFSTNSAACAYDAKHERLYYTPMGINELRYIDLKAKTPSVYYFENEAFGALSSRHDVQNQVTRMVIASDGNGYALTNNGNHLIKFTTDKRATITDLGELTDDGANGRFSVHSSGGYGGDMVADDKKNLYLITANRAVFKISLDTKVASYVGSIKGLPREFSTNGAVVEKGTSVIVSSANSTLGYFRFDIESLMAEKISNDGQVYNASDLANGNLISIKKKREDKEPEPIVEEKLVTASETGGNNAEEILAQNKMAVYPNPVAMGGSVKVSFKDQPKGIYTMQFMDIAGKLISSKQVTVSNGRQVEDYPLPELSARGNYLLKVVSDSKKVVSINKIVVQ